MKNEVFEYVDSLDKKSRAEQFNELLQNVSSLVPGFGGLLSNVFGGIYVQRRFERFKEVIMKLALEINRLGHGFDEYTASKDFADILYRTMLRVDQEGSEAKRELYGKFLKNVVANKLSYEEYSNARLWRFLEDLLPADIAVLSELVYRKEDSHNMVPIQKTLESKTGLIESQIIEVVEHLNRLGLVTIDRNGLKAPLTGPGGQYATHRGISPLGESLLKFLV